MSEIRSVGKPLTKLSGGGNKKKKLLIIGGGIGIIGVWYFYQARKANTATAVDPNAVDPNAVDPSLGGATSPATLGSYIDPSTGAVITSGTVPQTITQPPTNPAWAQQATAYLTQNGFDPVTVGIALGLYLAGKNLSNSQLQIVEAAIAAEGNPPTAVPAPHTAPPSGQNTGGVTGTPVAPVLKIGHQQKGAATLDWNAVASATGYRLYLNGVMTHSIGANPTYLVIHRNGSWRVSAVRGTHVSPRSNAVTVKGI